MLKGLLEAAGKALEIHRVVSEKCRFQTLPPTATSAAHAYMLVCSRTLIGARPGAL